MEKFDVNDLTVESSEVKAWQDGNADFDYTVCAESVVKDAAGNTYYVHYTNVANNQSIYIVSRYSAFDTDHFNEPDYVIEYYDGNNEEDFEDEFEEEEDNEADENHLSYEESAFYPFFVELEEMADKKYREILDELDDTRNYPNGRQCSVSMELNFEWYSKELDKYFQISQKPDQDDLKFKYTVTNTSCYMRWYMGPFYHMYFPDKPAEVEYLVETEDLNSFAWDDPYAFVFSQIRGMFEINNRLPIFAYKRYEDEEQLVYDGFVPYFLSVHRQQPDKGHKKAYVAMLGLLGPNNEVSMVYTCHFESGTIEYVYVPQYSQGERDPEKDYVYLNEEIAAKSEWREYFALLTALRKKLESGGGEIHWRAGSPDDFGVLNCAKQKLGEHTTYVWRDEISEDAFENPDMFRYGYKGEHLRVADIITAKNIMSTVKDFIKKNGSKKTVKAVNDESGFVTKAGDAYFHYIMMTAGEFPYHENSLSYDGIGGLL